MLNKRLESPLQNAFVGWWPFFAIGTCLFVGCQRQQPIEAIIVGGSMAPAYYGEHFQVTCDDCSYCFNVDTKIPKQGKFVCPNCGYTDISPPDLRSTPEIVSVIESEELSRWDTVAIKRAGETDAAVKRIVGLPLERINIRDGDIFVDSVRVRKSFEQQKDIRIAVFDSRFLPNSDVPDRWRSELPNSGWSQDSNGYCFKSIQTPNGQLDWLTYHHWPGFHHVGQRCQDAPIKDSYAFNQAINRALVPVADLDFLVEFDEFSAESIAVRLKYGNRNIEVQIFPAQNKIRVNSATGELTLDIGVGETGMSIELTTFDKLLRLLLNDKLVLEEPIPVSKGPEPAVLGRFSLGAKNGSLRISRVRIFRDIYYRDLEGAPVTGYELAANEYLVLGDNVPISMDSRHWERHAIKKREILGKVIRKSTNHPMD